MRAVQFSSPGPPSVLYVGQVDRPPNPEKGEVVVRVGASAVNRADTLQRKGMYPAPPGASPLLGLEAAGTVEELGPGVTDWRVGDRVMVLLAGGGNAELCTVPASQCLPVPKGMEVTQAAAIPEVWLTAYQLLHLVGQLKPKETVLVHAGGSGVGTAAVQLIKLAGGRSLVTAGSADKLSLAKQLGAEVGVNYKEEQFQEVVKEWTGGRGVDLILDCVGGSYAMQNLDCLALDGRWVLYGLMGGPAVEGPVLGGLLRKRGALLASTLRSRSDEYKAELVKGFRQTCLSHFSGPASALKPIVDKVYPVEEVGAAHSRMEENKNIGKIVLSF